MRVASQPGFGCRPDRAGCTRREEVAVAFGPWPTSGVNPSIGMAPKQTAMAAQA